jgi:hypothetical protein
MTAKLMFAPEPFRVLVTLPTLDLGVLGSFILGLGDGNLTILTRLGALLRVRFWLVRISGRLWC